MSTETVSAGQLRAFIERIERIEALEDERATTRPFYQGPRRKWNACKAVPAHWRVGPKFNPRRAGIPQAEAGLLLELCARLCHVGYANDGWADERKGYTISCRLTGLGWADTQKAIADTCVVGPDSAAVHWAEFMGPSDQRVIGYVYSAHSPAHPSVVKIGFSQTPEKRMKSLSRLHGVEINLGTCHEATMLHEWAIHQILRKQVAPEWYRAADVPAWLMPADLRRGAA